MTSVKLAGVAKSSDNQQVHYVATDPKASYTLLSPDVPEDYSPSCIDWVSADKVDYSLMPPTAQEGKYEASSVKNHGLPLSYLQIRTVEEGAEWYKTHTRYPDLVCDMLARYEFGDLRYTTKKEFKNLRKKAERKQTKRQTNLHVKRGPTIVSFD